MERGIGGRAVDVGFAPGPTLDPSNGELSLSQVLVPIDHSPDPASEFGNIEEFVSSLSNGARIELLLHVGEAAPVVRSRRDGSIIPVAMRTGDVVRTIQEVR